MSSNPVPTEPFAGLRPRLFGIAYRMLGVRADAEDVLQDAWLRWSAADHAALQSPEAWLVTVTTRLAIDRLRAAKTEREAYIGWWLPEPIVEVDERTPETAAELASDLSVAFLHMLERLGPKERAAFLLRQVFDYDYGEIAAIMKPPCRHGHDQRRAGPAALCGWPTGIGAGGGDGRRTHRQHLRGAQSGQAGEHRSPAPVIPGLTRDDKSGVSQTRRLPRLEEEESPNSSGKGNAP